MATQNSPKRPISPHLSHYRWGPAMTVSILHRVTGDGMATVGIVLLVAWLAMLAAGEAYYAMFVDWFTLSNGSLNILGYVVGIGLTLSLFQHIASGVRHLVMDTGANFELRGNRASATATMVVSVVATILFWAFIMVGK